ncbi:protein YIPF6 [Condylostylus longicornis]|uniref:protein YIPF6 n=1 Tax=Condylostylus longicornis TaxID=2530218 RepID=UPI00244DABED|nr:protein YIPF6 [Condylostylus longicornis]
METKLEVSNHISNSHLHGDMTINSTRHSEQQPGAHNFYTLDEPIKETIYRDVKAVGLKFYHVLSPTEKFSILRDWDLWGPLVLCTFMATILHGSADNVHDNGPEFAQIFLIVWIGAAVVTLNSKLLGGNISFFQSVCVLGYCLTPLAVALTICAVLLKVNSSKVIFVLRLITTSIGFFWATYASFMFLGDSQPPNRKVLSVYPIFLFYFIMSWLVISHS